MHLVEFCHYCGSLEHNYLPSGALAGGLITAYIYTQRKASRLQFFQLTDAVAVGVPFGQAIGRLGNWVNKELYGTPTDLPWKLFIDEAHRLPGYEHTAYYHPLFLYELLGVCGIGMLLVVLTKRKALEIGSAYPTVIYIAAYGWLRFFLEFFRLDKVVLVGTPLGVNQVIVLVAAISATIVLILKWRSKGQRS